MMIFKKYIKSVFWIHFQTVIRTGQIRLCHKLYVHSLLRLKVNHLIYNSLDQLKVLVSVDYQATGNMVNRSK